MDSHLAFNVAQKESLKKLLEYVAGRNITMPSTGQFMKTLKDQYDITQSKLKEILAKQKYVCVTSDVWFSRATSYLGNTVHFIGKDYVRQSYVLSFRQLKGKQTYDVLAKEMSSVFNEYSLSNEKITNVVTNGGSAVCKSFRIYGRPTDCNIHEDEPSDDEPSEEEEPAVRERSQMPFMNEDGESLMSNILQLDPTGSETSDLDFDDFNDIDDHVADDENIFQNLIENTNILEPAIVLPPQSRCFSHMLNNLSTSFEYKLTGTTKNALVAAQSKLHAVWVLVRRSSTTKSICKEILGCALLIPCATRWNSKFDAIELNCRPNIQAKTNTLIENLRLKLNSARNLDTLTTSDWAILHEYLNIMRPVANALEKLQGEKNCGQGYILPALIAMKHRISTQTGRFPTIMNELKRTMLKAIDDRLGKYCEFSERNLDLIVAAVSIPRFKNNFIANDVDERISRQFLISECSRLSDTNVNEPENSAPHEDDDFFVNFNDGPTRRHSIEARCDSEVIRYFNDDRKDESILDEYPLIRAVYFRYNTTLAVSAAVECLFSQSEMLYATTQ